MPLKEERETGVTAYKRDLRERITHHRKNLERSERLLKMLEDNVPTLEFLELANTPVEE